jgi:hypothetical protein
MLPTIAAAAVGLRLERRKGPGECLVIDQVETPSED